MLRDPTVTLCNRALLRSRALLCSMSVAAARKRLWWVAPWGCNVRAARDIAAKSSRGVDLAWRIIPALPHLPEEDETSYCPENDGAVPLQGEQISRREGGSPAPLFPCRGG